MMRMNPDSVGHCAVVSLDASINDNFRGEIIAIYKSLAAVATQCKEYCWWYNHIPENIQGVQENSGWNSAPQREGAAKQLPQSEKKESHRGHHSAQAAEKGMPSGGKQSLANLKDGPEECAQTSS